MKVGITLNKLGTPPAPHGFEPAMRDITPPSPPSRPSLADSWPAEHLLAAAQRAFGIDLTLFPVPADRSSQSAAVRAAAADLLRARGVVDPHIRRSADGAPLWPVGWTGSLSHSRTWGAAAIAPASALRSLGIDLEDPARMKPKLWPYLLCPPELAELDALTETAANRRVAAVFSAKEALYKTLAPLGGRVPGFKEVELRWTPDDRFTAHLFLPRLDEASWPRGLTGFVCQTHEHLLALAWLPA
ncbi:MAG: 4'-phosphopantetheinyl transferase superfamily protein [Verrucomicrobia bacterium]|nr:4'-phosphopantetheinyl transferase superfamily protein [Verrucomicrobiota bacterium]